MFSAGDLHYFRLVIGESESMWKKSQDPQEKGLGIRWPDNEVFDFQEVRLHMLLPS
jgi:hypothetical protein